MDCKKILFVFGFLFFVGVASYNYYLLEFDRFTGRISGTSFGDATNGAHSARLKYLTGSWTSEVDDWEPIYMVPIYSFFTYLGFILKGLTLTGLRLFSFIFILLLKILTCVLIYKELGKKYLILSLFLIPLLAPINEYTRIASLDTVQICFMFISFFFCIFSVQTKKWYMFFLAGFFATVGAFYKLSGLPFFIFPIIFYLFYYFKGENREDLNYKKSFLYTFCGIAFVWAMALFFWIVPHFDNIVYISWRLFGLNAKIIKPWEITVLISHALDFFNSEWGITHDKLIFSFHSIWIVPVIVLNILFVVRKKRNFNSIESAFITFSIIIFFQVVFFDMQWRRYFALIPVGTYALVKTISIIVNYKKFKFSKPNTINAILFSYLLQIVIFRSIFRIEYEQSKQNIVLILLVFFFSGALYYYILRCQKNKLFIFLIALILIFPIPHAVKFSMRYFTDLRTTVKDISVELNKKIGNARIIGPNWFTMYNKIRSIGCDNRPAGFRTSEGMTLHEYIKKYKNKDFKTKVAWMFGKIYPGFWEKFNLPENYFEKYKSNVFQMTYSAFATKQLVNGACEENAYISENAMSGKQQNGKKIIVYPKPILIKKMYADLETESYRTGLSIEKIYPYHKLYKIKPCVK